MCLIASVQESSSQHASAFLIIYVFLYVHVFYYIRTYAALETLTEPHQVISTLSCVTAVARSLVSDEQFPEGRVHIFDLLRLALPGIDLNDVPKMLVR